MTSNEAWRNFRKELVDPSKNSYVYKLGFRYAIMWYRRMPEVEAAFSTTFGPPNKQYHCSTIYGHVKIKPSFQQHRWFYGTRRWDDPEQRNRSHWAVFKTDADRTLALLML